MSLPLPLHLRKLLRALLLSGSLPTPPLLQPHKPTPNQQNGHSSSSTWARLWRSLPSRSHAPVARHLPLGIWVKMLHNTLPWAWALFSGGSSPTDSCLQWPGFQAPFAKAGKPYGAPLSLPDFCGLRDKSGERGSKVLLTISSSGAFAFPWHTCFPRQVTQKAKIATCRAPG